MEHKRNVVALVALSFLSLYAFSGCGSSAGAADSEPNPPSRAPQPVAEPPSPPQDTGRNANVYFRVRWDGEYIGGDITVRGLVRRADVVESRTGGQSNAVKTSPSTTVYEPITLLREPGIDDAFLQWAEKVFAVGNDLGSEMALANYRKTVVIELFDASSHSRIASYRASRCWPSEHAPAAVPSDAEQEFREWLVLQCDTWERTVSSE